MASADERQAEHDREGRSGDQQYPADGCVTGELFGAGSEVGGEEHDRRGDKQHPQQLEAEHG